MYRAATILLAFSLAAVVALPASADPVQWSGNGHWYEAVQSPMAWPDADAAARARMWMGIPGHLATITSQEENDFVTPLTAAIVGSCWLGGFQDPTDGGAASNWHWQTSEPWSYTNWHAGEPNDYYGGEERLLLYEMGTWNDCRIVESHYYVVEYDGLVGVEASTWGSIKALFGF